MSTFFIRKYAKSLRTEIQSIDYKGGAHQSLHAMLTTLCDKVKGDDSIKQTAYLLGAITFALRTIEKGYRYMSPTGGHLNAGSSLYQALSKILTIQALHKADNRSQVETFALQAFFQWYQINAYSNEEGKLVPHMDNPFKELIEKIGFDTTAFEKQLKEMTKGLPAITTAEWSKLRTHGDISSFYHTPKAGSTLEDAAAAAPASSAASSSWGLSSLFSFFGNVDTSATKPESVAATATTALPATAALAPAAISGGR